MVVILVLHTTKVDVLPKILIQILFPFSGKIISSCFLKFYFKGKPDNQFNFLRFLGLWNLSSKTAAAAAASCKRTWRIPFYEPKPRKQLSIPPPSLVKPNFLLPSQKREDWKAREFFSRQQKTWCTIINTCGCVYPWCIVSMYSSRITTYIHHIENHRSWWKQPKQQLESQSSVLMADLKMLLFSSVSRWSLKLCSRTPAATRGCLINGQFGETVCNLSNSTIIKMLQDQQMQSSKSY